MTKLVVFSHKLCWQSADSPSGYATDGGFPFQMRALAELFDSTVLVVPCTSAAPHSGEVPLSGHGLSIAPLTVPRGTGTVRKLAMPVWLVRNAPVLLYWIARARAVHVPVPSDVGTIGMIAAFLMRKPLFVRHCGNWLVQKTWAEHFWKYFMERFAGGRNVMLATGGGDGPPSAKNSNIRWIFSTTLSEQELNALPRVHRSSQLARPKLIIACRQQEEKGTRIVIESLPAILNQLQGATLDVVGDGPALSSLRKRANELNIGEHIRFHGNVDHARLIELLKQADLFCYPTRASEGFPKVVLEALACGLPVITTRVSVLPALLAAGSGVLIDTASPSALAEAVKYCLMDSLRYSRMSRIAIETARQYSIERWRQVIAGMLEKNWDFNVQAR
jgi:glycosyltransferase involved in cell wall biosynthesis